MGGNHATPREVVHSSSTRSGHTRRTVACGSPAQSAKQRYSSGVRAARTESGPSTRATRDEESTAVPIIASQSPSLLRTRSDTTTPQREAEASDRTICTAVVSSRWCRKSELVAISHGGQPLATKPGDEGGDPPRRPCPWGGENPPDNPLAQGQIGHQAIIACPCRRGRNPAQVGCIGARDRRFGRRRPPLVSNLTPGERIF